MLCTIYNGSGIGSSGGGGSGAAVGVLLNARVVGTANLALTGIPASASTDYIPLDPNDIILLLAQTAPSENGPWVVSSGAWSRPTNFDTSAECYPGTLCSIGPEGRFYRNLVYQFRNYYPIILGTSALTFKQARGAESRRTLPYTVTPRMYWPLDAPYSSLAQFASFGGTLPFTATAGTNGPIAGTAAQSCLGTGCTYCYGIGTGYFKTATTTLVPATTDFRFGCWIKLLYPGAATSLIATIYDNNTNLSLHGVTIDSGSKIGGFVTVAGVKYTAPVSARVLIPGEPYFVEVTKSNGDQRIRTFINGVEANSIAGGAANSVVTFGAGGHYYALHNNPNATADATSFSGNIEELTLYNSYATPDVSGIYSTGVGRGPAD